MRLLVAVALALGCTTVPLASGHTAAGMPGGSYTVVDGPAAGQDVHVGGNGTASVLDRASQLRAVGPDDDCDEPHLHGTLDGKDEPTGGCGWGRILQLSKATPTMRDLANAITEEERAIASLVGQPTQKPHWEFALYGQLGVEHTLEALAAAEKEGAIASGTADRVRTRLTAAHAIDSKLKTDMQATPNASTAVRNGFVRELRNALSLKRDALTIVEHAGLKAADNDTAPSPCGGRRVASAADCVATVPGRPTDPRRPVFAGAKQTQKCVVTNRLRKVNGELKRVVHFSITLTGTQHGPPRPVRVVVYWPA